MTLPTVAAKSSCATCEKNTGIFTCGGCNRAFCTKHANEHRQILGQEMDEIVIEHDQLRQSINEQIDDRVQCSSIKQIDQWEQESIDKIRQVAEAARERLKQYLNERNQRIQIAVQELKETLNKARIEDDFVETDLKQWVDKINELKIDISTSIPIFFKNIDNDVIRFVTYPHPQDDSHPRTIELPKTVEGLGFNGIGGREENLPIYIERIIPNGVAWEHGGLKIGDQLLSINDISVENECMKKAVDLVKQAQESVRLVVRYSPHSFNRFFLINH